MMWTVPELEHRVKPPNYPIESVDNALKLVLALMDRPALAVSEAGELLEVAPSTAHRLLSTLAYRGFVEQDPATRLYRSGPVLLKLGLTAVRNLDLRRRARPIIEDLSQEVGETVNLVILQGTDILFIDCVEAPSIVRVGSRMGVLLPAHCTAGGKALLSTLSTEELRELYPEPRLEQLTTNSFTKRADLEQELEVTRTRGFATNDEESENGLSAFAAPICDREGHALGAIAIAAPSGRITADRITVIGEAVQHAAQQISDSAADAISVMVD
ncbi:MAG: IclR family transcriptional regulator [Euzebya sp.]